MIKTAILSFIVFAISSLARAEDFYCDMVYNAKTILNTKVKAVSHEKVIIGKSSVISAYITAEDNTLYTIEAFIPEYEVRVYGKGSAQKEGDVVSASVWGRDSIVDVNCRLVK